MGGIYEQGNRVRKSLGAGKRARLALAAVLFTTILAVPRSVSAGPAPAAPSELRVTGLTATSTRLSWIDNSNDEIHFRIERAPCENPVWTEIAQTGPDETSYTDTSFTPGYDYQYQVRADNGVPGGYSNEARALAAPDSASANIQVFPPIPLQVSLSWVDHSSFEAGYRVERSTDNGVTWTHLVPDLPASTATFIDNAAACDTRNYYRIYAYNSDGNSAYTSASALTLPCPPVLRANPGPTSIRLEWQTHNPSNRFELIRKFPTGEILIVEIFTQGQTSFLISDLTYPSGPFWFYVNEQNDAGKISSNEVETATVPCRILLPVVKR